MEESTWLVMTAEERIALLPFLPPEKADLETLRYQSAVDVNSIHMIDAFYENHKFYRNTINRYPAFRHFRDRGDRFQFVLPKEQRL